MFNENTQKQLQSLSEEDLFKVSKMIQKLSRKNSSTPKNKKQRFVSSTRGNDSSYKKESKGENLFLSMPERNAHKEDSEIDKLLSVHPPTERSRASSLISVVCNSCGKTLEVSASIVPQERDRFICNNCQIRGVRK